MNTKAVIPLVAGLGIAGLAGKLGFDYIKKAQGATPKTVQLWSVAQDVPRGSAIAEVSLQPLAFPANLVPQDAVQDKTKLVGRVPHTGVPAGVPVLESMLLAPGTKPGIHVPPGFRAIAVKINDSSGVDNHLDPGVHVDVVAYFTLRGQGGRQETIARTIVENVEVAAVGSRISAEPPPSNNADAKDKDKNSKAKKTEAPKPARAVTLLVKPDQVPVIHLAEQKGELKLSMRCDVSETDDGKRRKDLVKEGQVLGLETDEPKEEADEKPSLGLGEMLSGLFSSKPAPAVEPAPKIAEPEPAPVVETQPQYQNILTIYSGNEKRVVGWLPGHSEAIEISSSEGPNLFDEHSRATSKKPKSKHESKDPAGGSTTGPGAEKSEAAKPKPGERLPTKPEIPTKPEPQPADETGTPPQTDSPENEAKELIG